MGVLLKVVNIIKSLHEFRFKTHIIYLIVKIFIGITTQGCVFVITILLLIYK